MLLGDIIKQYRIEHNMSLQDFAERIGTSRSYIHMLEKNINPSTNKPISPSIETLKLLASAMYMDLDTLLKQINGEQDIYLDENEYQKQFKLNNLFASRLKKAMKIRNMKQSDIIAKSEILHNNNQIRFVITEKTLDYYLKGYYETARIDDIYTLASILNIDEFWLMGYDVPMDRKPINTFKKNNNSNSIDTKQAFPVLGIVKAGYDYLAQENWIGYISIDKEVSDPENYYALKVLGDSMQPILYENDIVLVHQQNDIESGQVGIVLIDNEEATIKKIIKYEDYIELIAFNSYYPSKRLTKKDNFKIIGKVTEARISKIFE